MKRVLFISSLYYPHIGGIETMITELSHFCHKDNFYTKVLTKRWPFTLPEYDKYKGIEIYRVVSARDKEEFESIINWLKENGSKIKSDVVHVIGMRRPLPFIGLLISRLWKIPIICTIAGGEIPDKIDSRPAKVWEEGEKFIPDVLRQSDYINCVSGALVRELKELMPDLKNIETLYAGVDFSIIRGAQPEKIKDQYILSLRRLDYSKGVDILIRAFNLIKDIFPKLYLVIAGEGAEKNNLKNIVEDCSLCSRVIFIGAVGIERGISLLKGADLTVVPSRSEGGGLVNIEAQAAGCPVIASRVGGIPEYVKDGESGILFESGNFQELANKISLLLNDKIFREQIIEGGYKYAQKFNWEMLTPQYINLYEKAITNYDKNKNFRPWSDLTAGLWNKLTNEYGRNPKNIDSI